MYYIYEYNVKKMYKLRNICKKMCNNNIQINTIYTYISIFITQVNNYTK